jgi:hypothetical protein
VALAPNPFWVFTSPVPIAESSASDGVITTSSEGQLAVICNESSSTIFMIYEGQ